MAHAFSKVRYGTFDTERWTSHGEAMRMSRWGRTKTRAATVGALAALTAALCATSASAAVTQPKQPATGPGGSDYAHAGVRVSSGGTGADAWFAFEPTKPRPKSASLAIVTHGYYEFSGYASLAGLIRHTVRKGSVVIYPRWQTAVATPCPGPIDIEPCMRSEVAGIRGALAALRSGGRRSVQPRLARADYFGFSFGGIITANLVSRHKALGLPKPAAVFLDDPHDGGIVADGEPGLDETLKGIPASTLLECHSGAQGVLTTPSTVTPGKDRMGSSCNALFPRLTTIPAKHKDLVMTSPDAHGTPGLSSAHGVCAGGGGGEFAASDAYDWGFCWKTWDALRSCAASHVDCAYALGRTPQHRYIGTWSDGVPIVGLKVQQAAPIHPTPVPARQRAPKKPTRGAR